MAKKMHEYRCSNENNPRAPRLLKADLLDVAAGGILNDITWQEECRLESFTIHSQVNTGQSGASAGLQMWISHIGRRRRE